ncbi:MAG: nucleoside 2-deoxyribosyltransferase [Bacteroidales bacterium]|jgi:nucleoside 2-deoxyribosyltransferase|nr:nucleoside 2-deoxyribosyltransferase [Bacteroidales bacterium]
MKIYFCASIRGGREMREEYQKLIGMLQVHGKVLTEHIADPALIPQSELNLKDTQIYEQDRAWLEEADVVVAEVTTPSLGVGFEIGYALQLKKPILCLFREDAEKRLSAMITGCKDIKTIYYNHLDELRTPLENFLK